MQMTKATVKQFEKEGKFEEAAKYAKAHPFVEMTWMRNRIGGYYKQIDELLEKPVHGEEGKRKNLIDIRLSNNLNFGFTLLCKISFIS